MQAVACSHLAHVLCTNVTPGLNYLALWRGSVNLVTGLGMSQAVYHKVSFGLTESIHQ